MNLLIIAIVIGSLVVGIVSQKYLGKNNAVEEVAEEVIEKELGLPEHSLEIPDIWTKS